MAKREKVYNSWMKVIYTSIYSKFNISIHLFAVFPKEQFTLNGRYRRCCVVVCVDDGAAMESTTISIQAETIRQTVLNQQEQEKRQCQCKSWGETLDRKSILLCSCIGKLLAGGM